MLVNDGGAGTAPRQAQDLAGAVLAGVALLVPPVVGLALVTWSLSALPMLALGLCVPRVPGVRWWRLPAVLALTLLPVGWAIGSDAPLVALTLLAAFLLGVCASACALGRKA